MKKIACMVIAAAGLTTGAFGDSRVGPFVSGMASAGNGSGSAFGGGIKYEWLFHENLGIDLRGGYYNDGDMGLIPLQFGPTVVIPVDPLAVTFGAGGVFAIPTDGDADPAFGFYAVGGIRGPLANGVEWFSEVEYANVKGDDNEKTTYHRYGYTTVSEPHLDFSAVGLNVGLLWKF